MDGKTFKRLLEKTKLPASYLIAISLFFGYLQNTHKKERSIPRMVKKKQKQYVFFGFFFKSDVFFSRAICRFFIVFFFKRCVFAKPKNAAFLLVRRIHFVTQSVYNPTKKKGGGQNPPFFCCPPHVGTAYLY